MDSGVWTLDRLFNGVTVSIVKMFKQVDPIRKLPLTEGPQENQLYKIGKHGDPQIIDPEILFGKCVLLPAEVPNEYLTSLATEGFEHN